MLLHPNRKSYPTYSSGRIDNHRKCWWHCFFRLLCRGNNNIFIGEHTDIFQMERQQLPKATIVRRSLRGPPHCCYSLWSSVKTECKRTCALPYGSMPWVTRTAGLIFIDTKSLVITVQKKGQCRTLMALPVF